MNIALGASLAKFPIEQIRTTICEHISPLIYFLPDKHLKHVAERIILGILGRQTPVITEIARQSSKDEGETWLVAKNTYTVGWRISVLGAATCLPVYCEHESTCDQLRQLVFIQNR